MPRNREPVDLREVYEPEMAEAFKQHVHRFFVQLETEGRMPEKPKNAEVLPFPTKARHSGGEGTA